jgi:hypothetical protein
LIFRNNFFLFFSKLFSILKYITMINNDKHNFFILLLINQLQQAPAVVPAVVPAPAPEVAVVPAPAPEVAVVPAADPAVVPAPST